MIAQPQLLLAPIHTQRFSHLIPGRGRLDDPANDRMALSSHKTAQLASSRSGTCVPNAIRAPIAAPRQANRLALSAELPCANPCIAGVFQQSR